MPCSLKTGALDAEYMRAVESGNEQRLRELVEQAAREAGYKYEAWHGSDHEKRFTIFRNGARGEMWFASTETTAYDRKQMYHVYLKMDNPYEETDYIGADTKFDPTSVTEKGRSNGHDGAIVHFRLDPEMVKRNLGLLSEDMPATNKFGDYMTFMPHGKDRANLAKPGESMNDLTIL